ncbi:MAG: A/G-specific adenine glycosylase [Oscillospiraceae bacterium]|nr:A/G-specific adenine glycosylase [Oscillospiraceae bacterium]
MLEGGPAMASTERIREALPLIITWYQANRRSLPWREDPTPYQVWVSEIMLQQTRIEAVIPYYRRFLQELPDLPALASVTEDRLLKLWEGLGYYSRARNLKKAAMLAMENYQGSLPAQAAELKKLPGIGDYTAAAIASIAFGEPEPAVDGNVLRVITRLLADSDDIANSKTRTRFSSLLKEHYPRGENASLLTEGLMELGEVICLPNGMPLCAQCPLRHLCVAHENGKELDYPVKSGLKERRMEEKTVLLLQCGNRFAIRKRPGKGLLAGLWEFPNIEGKLDPSAVLPKAAEMGISVLAAEPCGNAKHVFTHVEWRMTGYRLLCPSESEGFLWLTREEIAEGYSIPTAFRAWQKLLESFTADQALPGSDPNR